MQTIDFNEDELETLSTAVALRRFSLAEIRNREKALKKTTTMLYREVSRSLESIKNIEEKITVALEKEWNNA